MHQYVLALIEINMKAGVYFQTKNPAPALVDKHYKTAIKLADEMLRLSVTQLTTRIYYSKARALLLLSSHYSYCK